LASEIESHYSKDSTYIISSCVEYVEYDGWMGARDTRPKKKATKKQNKHKNYKRCA